MKRLPYSQIDLDSRRDADIPAQLHLIDGNHVPASDGSVLDVISPINGKVITTIADGSADDVELATKAARRTFESGVWSNMPPAERKKILLRWADLVEKAALDLAVLGVRDNGTEIGMAYKAEPLSAAGTIRYYAEAVDKVYGEIANTGPDRLGLIHKEPVGVVGVIVPWNFPLMIASWKLAPALAAGNSVVLKPAEVASLSLIKLCQLAHEAGLPPGVLNVVTGRGASVGEAIGLSMEIDVLAFTGSGGVGRRLLDYSARSNLKRVYLELGGKSPLLIFNDTSDLKAATKAAVSAIFRNSGQVCIAASRLLVQNDIRADFVELIAAEAEAQKVGDPLDMSNQIGAVTSQVQLDQNLRFVEDAKADGNELVCGGEQILMETGGYYMSPTIFNHVQADDRLAQNEVFGPVLAVQGFDTEDEAITIANSTNFGLSSGVWTSDLSRAHRVVRKLKAGLVHVNTYGGSENSMPLGGVKQSGNGHDKSMHAFDKYLDLKSAWFAL